MNKTMEKIRTKVEVGHSKECSAVDAVTRGHWFSPWSGVLDQASDVAFLAKNGRGKGHTLWWRMVCNSTHCPGRLLVNSDDVLAIIEAQDG